MVLYVIMMEGTEQQFVTVIAAKTSDVDRCEEATRGRRSVQGRNRAPSLGKSGSFTVASRVTLGATFILLACKVSGIRKEASPPFNVTMDVSMRRLLSRGCASGRIRELVVLTGTGIEDLTEALPLQDLSLLSCVLSEMINLPATTISSFGFLSLKLSLYGAISSFGSLSLKLSLYGENFFWRLLLSGEPARGRDALSSMLSIVAAVYSMNLSP